MHDSPNIPLEDFTSDGSVLANWLGSFWTQVFTQPDLVINLEQGHALNLAQVYLDFLESVALLNRRDAPVFHRERWTPIVLKKSEQNTGKGNLLRTDMVPAPYIGPQPENTPYPPGRIFEIGGHAEYENTTSYPLDAAVVDVITCVTDNIMSPTRILIRGIDYFVRDSTLFFLRDGDPFNSGVFPVRDIDGDEEVLLWACNTLVDKSMIYEHVGYVLSIHRPKSTAFYKAMLNGLWDMYNMGTPLRWFASGVGAVVGEPTVLSDGEIVEVILQETGVQLVVTDKQVYRVHKNATLRAAVVPDGVLNTGDFLTESVRVYDTLDPLKLAACSEFSERLKTDAFSLFFNKDWLRAPVKRGVGASWDVQDIVRDGADADGNSRLRFKLYGPQEDIDIFWADFWAYLESHEMTSETCFQGYLDAIVVPVDGAVYGRVAPLEYFMRYFMRANAMIVLIERDKLAAPDEHFDALSALSHLKKVTPAHVVVFVIEQRTLGPDTYDLSEVDHSVELMHVTTAQDTIRPGGPSATQATYMVRPPAVRWIPTCKE
jgi:hypothetical protein